MINGTAVSNNKPLSNSNGRITWSRQVKCHLVSDNNIQHFNKRHQLTSGFYFNPRRGSARDRVRLARGSARDRGHPASAIRNLRRNPCAIPIVCFQLFTLEHTLLWWLGDTALLKGDVTLAKVWTHRNYAAILQSVRRRQHLTSEPNRLYGDNISLAYGDKHNALTKIFLHLFSFVLLFFEPKLLYE
jgi:hypothetical protein